MSEPTETSASAAPVQKPSSRGAGFHFNSVVVDRLSLRDLSPGETRPEALKFSFKFRRRMTQDPPGVEITVLVDIRPQEGSSFLLEAEISGQFEREDGPQVLTLEDFAKANGPALVMPYARELVTNITARTRHGVIIFPPVNIVQLVMDEEKPPA
jgi:preprotein translocase subunit SecB